MPAKRPTAVLVMAILNFVFGGGNVLCSLCAGVGIAILALMINQPGMANDPNMRELKEVLASMNRDIPLMIPFAIGSAVVGLILSIILIIAGIGLLKLRPWARNLCIFYGVVAILVQIGELLFRILYMGPATEEWQRNFVAHHGQIRPQANNPFASNPAANSVLEVAGTIFGMAYAIALLVVMFLPRVSAAFSGRGMEDYEQQRLAEDQEEGGYERREREEGDGGEARWND
jgi:hypothetical protein